MVDVVLLAGRLLVIALLYLFLFAAIKAGIGLVRGTGASAARRGLLLAVAEGPRELKGVRVPIDGPVVIGRSPGADIVIADDFVSGSHARVAPSGDGAIVEDLGSTNGTILGTQRVYAPTTVKAGDVITIGKVKLKVEKS